MRFRCGAKANRVVLLTDGQANVGVVDPIKLIGLARAGAEKGVSTTCIGFGAAFNEQLLEPMGAAGAGNYWYVESYDQMAAIFQGEVEGLVSVAAQNVELEVRLTRAHTHTEIERIAQPNAFTQRGAIADAQAHTDVGARIGGGRVRASAP